MYTQRSTKKFEKPQNLTQDFLPVFSYQFGNVLSNIAYFQRKLLDTTLLSSNKLKESHHNTLNILAKRYIRSTEKFYSIDDIRSMDEMPPYRIHGETIKKITGKRSISTVYDHRKRLINLGLVERTYTDDERTCQYWVFSKFLFLRYDLAKIIVDKLVENVWKSPEPENFDVAKWLKNAVRTSIFEHIKPGISFSRPTIDSPVDIVNKSHLQSGSPNGALKNAFGDGTGRGPFFGTTRGKVEQPVGKIQGAKEEHSAKKLKQVAPVARSGDGSPVRHVAPATTSSKSKPTASKPTASKPTANVPPFLLTLILEFWMQAKTRLFAHSVYSAEQERRILNTLFVSEFNCYRTPNQSQDYWEKKYLKLTAQLVEAQKLMAKYQFTPPPAEQYFAPPDPKHPKAFRFHKVKKYQGVQLLEKIRREIRQWQVHRGRCKHYSHAQLVTRHTKWLHALDHAETSNLYLQKYLNSYVRKK